MIEKNLSKTTQTQTHMGNWFNETVKNTMMMRSGFAFLSGRPRRVVQPFVWVVVLNLEQFCCLGVALFSLFLLSSLTLVGSIIATGYLFAVDKTELNGIRFEGPKPSF